MRTPKRLISSKLCRVVLEIITPAHGTGSNSATGVITPLLPTENIIFLTVVVACGAGYLKAIAQRGLLAVTPNIRWSSNRFTFTTRPSTSKGSWWRDSLNWL